MRLLVATGNAHKLKEFGRILSPLGIDVVSMAEVNLDLDVEETGQTFAENAEIKAKAMFGVCGIPVVADDSGLCVDALDGRPGVYSARYLGDAPQNEKNAALLKEMKDVPQENRTARFVCAIHCILSNDTGISVEGVCEGSIGYEPKGEDGFGYDPLFLCGGKTFAELSGDEKDAQSHRGLALRELAEKLEEYLKTKK